MSVAAAHAGTTVESPQIERVDPALDRLIAPDTRIEIVAHGFDWSDGPVWVKDGGFLLFSDVPQNIVVRWKDGEGARPWLKPSGYTGREARGGDKGCSALLIDSEGRLVLCQHGDRCIVRMDAPLSAPVPAFVAVADGYEGARFNGPHDAVFHSQGDLYFTDPPFGLSKPLEDSARELPCDGVFRRHRIGGVTLLTDEMTRPNGVAFSPDEQTLYVSQSDPDAPIWRAFDVRADGALGSSRVLFDAGALPKHRRGTPGGMKIDTDGHLFAAGPGGVLILTPDGRHLGTILTGQATTNCAFGDDGRSLYITADMYLMRVRLTTQGLGCY